MAQDRRAARMVDKDKRKSWRCDCNGICYAFLLIHWTLACWDSTKMDIDNCWGWMMIDAMEIDNLDGFTKTNGD